MSRVAPPSGSRHPPRPAEQPICSLARLEDPTSEPPSQAFAEQMALATSDEIPIVGEADAARGARLELQARHLPPAHTAHGPAPPGVALLELHEAVLRQPRLLIEVQVVHGQAALSKS